MASEIVLSDNITYGSKQNDEQFYTMVACSMRMLMTRGTRTQFHIIYVFLSNF